MKVVLYARVSTRGQAGRGALSDQLWQLADHAQKQGDEVVGSFGEIGISGLDVDRPVLDDMVKFVMVPKHEVKEVLVISPSRLCRDAAELRFLKERLREAGVRITATTQDPNDGDGELCDCGTLAISDGSV